MYRPHAANSLEKVLLGLSHSTAALHRRWCCSWADPKKQTDSKENPENSPEEGLTRPPRPSPNVAQANQSTQAGSGSKGEHLLAWPPRGLRVTRWSTWSKQLCLLRKAEKYNFLLNRVKKSYFTQLSISSQVLHFKPNLKKMLKVEASLL